MDELTRRVKKRIRQFREEKELTRVELARRAGVHPSFITLLEGDYEKGMTVQTLGSLAQALGVEPEHLVARERSEVPDPHGEPGLSCEEREVLTSLRRVRGHNRARILRRILSSLSQEERAAASLSGATLLRDVAPLTRGIGLPDGAVVPGYPFDEAGDRRTRYLAAMETILKRTLMEAGDVWSAIVEKGPVEVRQTIRYCDLRPFSPHAGSGAMLYISQCPSIYKDSKILDPDVKIIIESRTGLAAIDVHRLAVQQPMLVAVPVGESFEHRHSIAWRVSAVLNSMDPHSLLPGVKWLTRSYRPRVSEVGAIPFHRSITSESKNWDKVENLAWKSAHSIEDRSRPDDDVRDWMQYFLRMKQELPYRKELKQAVDSAMREPAP